MLILALKAFGVEGEPTRDVVTEAGLSPWTGGISTASLLLWGATAGAAGIAGMALWRGGQREAARFLLITAAGVGYLGLDDALLIHEDVAPNKLGIPQRATYLLLAFAALVWALRFRSSILRSDIALFAFTASAFGVAAALDLLHAWSVAGEDWVKYVGLAGLAGWVADTCLRWLGDGREPGQRSAGGPPPAGQPLSAPRRRHAPGGVTPPPAR